MGNEREYLHHVHGASANEASILIDAHEAIETREQLSESDENSLVSLLTSFRNSHLVYEYMDIFYGDSPWPALEEVITIWLITSSNYIKKDTFFNLIKPYYDRVKNIDWLFENLKRNATSNLGIIKPLSIIPKMVELAINNSYNTANIKTISSLFTPYLERAAKAVAQIYGPESIVTATHLWETISAVRNQGPADTTIIYDWAIAQKLYYFKQDELYIDGFRKNFTDACSMFLKNKAQYEKMFSMFDFDDFLEDTRLILPYCQKVLEGRFYDIEDYLKTMEYTRYKYYIQSAPQFTDYWKNHL